MNDADWNLMLRRTADDDRLSRGERAALRGRIQEAALDERLRAVLRSQAFGIAREHLASGPSAAVLDWLEDVVKLLVPDSEAPATVEAHFSPGEECRRRIISLFGACRRSADACVFTLTDDRISAAVIEAHRRGVVVRIVTDDEKARDVGSDARRLAAAGIPVRVDDSPYHMHHKFAVFDGASLLTGSYNWTVGAALNNQENLVTSNDPRLVGPFIREFERLWTKFEGRVP
jgi:phosphatidylserine/phosphatidylglycerophosphate/cardiolipin synthase-like enzyme